MRGIDCEGKFGSSVKRSRHITVLSDEILELHIAQFMEID